jgi:uncharacterized protein (TIRG00374 family)
MQLNSRIILFLQAVIGFLIIILAIWYVGAQGLAKTLASARLEYVMLCLLAYFGMNLLFTIRLVRVLGSLGFKIGLWKTLIIQYGGMLASDFTPARSGYFAVPLMLKERDIPIASGLSSILGCQSIEFLIKMLGGTVAIAYLTSKTQLSQDLYILSIFGVLLMLLGSGAIALAMWSKKALGLIEHFNKIPLIGRLVSLLMEKISEFQRESEKVKNVIHEITILTIASWIFKGFEWYFIGLALGIDSISWFGYFIIHPLITALSFIPLTPSGLGFQEGGIVGVLYLLGIDFKIGLAFAILVRTLLILEDLIGIQPLSKVGIRAIKTV